MGTSPEKMLGNKKVFGRCNVEGHGCGCSVSREIQSIPMSKAKEKREAKKIIIEELITLHDH